MRFLDGGSRCRAGRSGSIGGRTQSPTAARRQVGRAGLRRLDNQGLNDRRGCRGQPLESFGVVVVQRLWRAREACWNRPHRARRLLRTRASAAWCARSAWRPKPPAPPVFRVGPGRAVAMMATASRGMRNRFRMRRSMPMRAQRVGVPAEGSGASHLAVVRRQEHLGDHSRLSDHEPRRLNRHAARQSTAVTRAVVVAQFVDCLHHGPDGLIDLA